MYATLIQPYCGYYNIELLEQISGQTWLAEICGSGKEIVVNEDEFTRT